MRYVHAPVVGSLGPARARALSVLLGGAPDDVEEASTFTNLWGSERAPVRLRGRSAAAKLVANLAAEVSMLVEALRLGRGGGLTTEEVVAGLDGTPLAPIVAVKGQTLRSNAFDDTQFATDALANGLRGSCARTAVRAIMNHGAQLGDRGCRRPATPA